MWKIGLHMNPEKQVFPGQHGSGKIPQGSIIPESGVPAPQVPPMHTSDPLHVEPTQQGSPLLPHATNASVPASTEVRHVPALHTAGAMHVEPTQHG